MSTDPITIPSTPIVERYRRFGKLSRKQQLDLAEELIRDPLPLADEYAQSLSRFSSYEAPDSRFYPAARRHRPLDRDPLRRTIDLALRFKEAGRLVPTAQVDGAIGVGAESLAFDYIDRELVAARTTGGARFDDDAASPATTAIRLDLLLVNSSDQTPIIGEVKIATDKTPVAALVQLLACAAHLATPNQYERLQEVYDNRFADVAPPRLDLYIVLARYPHQATHMTELLRRSQDLSAALLRCPEVNATVRRIASLHVDVDAMGVPSGGVQYALEAPG